MSRRDLIRMTDDEVEAFLQGRHTMNVGTFNHDGSIHLVAMWYGFLDGDAVFETFAKSQKVLNLRRDPRITVLVEDGDSYDQLRGVEMVGHADIVEDPELVKETAKSVLVRYQDITDPADIEAAAALMANKRVAIRIRPERVVSWDHNKLAGGY
ncbi:MAG: class probable F420-dependent enzyme [Acidimicrobiales bacterium]|nr:class probable F420-dependent enzyme [Acidimicrobiales bacterium]